MCHGFELYGNLIRHITKENVSFSTTRNVCRSSSHKNNSLVYLFKSTSLVFFDGFVSTVLYFNALRNGSVPLLNRFVTDMNTASSKYDSASPQTRNYILEIVRNNFKKRYFYLCRKFISTLFV